MPPDGKLSTDAGERSRRVGAHGRSRSAHDAPGGQCALTYGGSGKNHWAFKPVTKPAPPAVKNAAWVKNDIDRFVLAKLEAERHDRQRARGQAHADPPRLLRSHRPAADAGAGERVPRRRFSERLREGRGRLLASPHYGERWGRHWLDVARYSDTKGQFDRRREETPIYPYAWTYRDYVIKAFNDDLPYDQFIREQLAADRLDGQNAGRIRRRSRRSGFLTLGDHFNGNVNDIINDRIDVTSKAFLGLTVTCARCHDHKFDPIPTADYYSLYGIFASSIEPADKPVIAPPNAANARLPREAPRDGRAHQDACASRTSRICSATTGGMAPSTCWPRRCRRASAPLISRRTAPTRPLLQNWISLTRRAFRPGVPIFGVWNALARIPAERFAQQAPRVSLLESVSRTGDARPRLSPIVS